MPYTYREYENVEPQQRGTTKYAVVGVWESDSSNDAPIKQIRIDRALIPSSRLNELHEFDVIERLHVRRQHYAIVRGFIYKKGPFYFPCRELAEESILHNAIGHTVYSLLTDTIYCQNLTEGEFVTVLDYHVAALGRTYMLHEGKYITDSVSGDIVPCNNCGEAILIRDQNGIVNNLIEHDGYYYCCEECLDAATHVWSDGTRHHEPEPSNDQFYSYHSAPRPALHETTAEHPWLIGFEIEQESRSLYNEMDYGEHEFDLPCEWFCERDGSLDYGYELISPAYNLTKEMRTIKAALRKLDKGGYIVGGTYRCGGHITISHVTYPRHMSARFADKLTGVFALLLALYPQRLNGTYAEYKKKYDCVHNPVKYSPFHFKRSGAVELRIFARVHSLSCILWRLSLLRMLLVELDCPSVEDIVAKLRDKRTRLHAKLREVYSEQRVADKIMLVSAFAKHWQAMKVNHKEADVIADFVTLNYRDDVDRQTVEPVDERHVLESV